MTLASFLQITHLTFFQPRLCEELHNGHYLILFCFPFFKQFFKMQVKHKCFLGKKVSNEDKTSVPFDSYPIMLLVLKPHCCVVHYSFPVPFLCIYKKNYAHISVYGFVLGLCVCKLILVYTLLCNLPFLLNGICIGYT